MSRGSTEHSVADNPIHRKSQAASMFDRIASRYDLLNHLLSGRRDIVWRRQLADQLQERTDLHLLDLATGTADQLLAMFKSGRVRSGIGIDLAEKMLEIGKDKISKLGLRDSLALSVGDAMEIPFEDNSFDAVSISFGIRNVTDVPKTLSEMRRTLKPGGRAMILEFSLPKSRIVRSIYLAYFRHLLPHLGGLISGDSSAYKYLNQTVETFPYGDDFCELMRRAGLKELRFIPLTFGIASIYIGIK